MSRGKHSREVETTADDDQSALLLLGDSRHNYNPMGDARHTHTLVGSDANAALLDGAAFLADLWSVDKIAQAGPRDSNYYIHVGYTGVASLRVALRPNGREKAYYVDEMPC